jgi:DNA-binding MarR family transcriptional regulator
LETSRQALLAAVGAASREFRRAVDAVDDAVARQLGVNRTDLRTIDVLFDGPASAGALAAATGMSPAAMTAALDRLEARGYVRRVRDTGDRRRVQVEVTDLTRRVAGELYGPIATGGVELIDRYSDAELSAIEGFLRSSRELQERHRERIVATKLEL